MIGLILHLNIIRCLVHKLGIIRDEEGEVVMHRTLLKIILNPILRKFGYSIVSHISDEGEFMKYQCEILLH